MRTKQTARKSTGGSFRRRYLSPEERLLERVETLEQAVQQEDMLYECDQDYLEYLHLAVEEELGATEDSDVEDILNAIDYFEGYRESFDERLQRARRRCKAAYDAAKKVMVEENQVVLYCSLSH